MWQLPKKWSQNLPTAPWWLATVLVLKLALSVLADGTWAKLRKNQSTCQTIYSQRCFLSFSLVLISYLKQYKGGLSSWLTIVCVNQWGACDQWSWLVGQREVNTTEIPAVQTLAPNYVTNVRWQQLCQGYFGFIFGKWDEVEKQLCIKSLAHHYKRHFSHNISSPDPLLLKNIDKCNFKRNHLYLSL